MSEDYYIQMVISHLGTELFSSFFFICTVETIETIHFMVVVSPQRKERGTHTMQPTTPALAVKTTLTNLSLHPDWDTDH